MSNCLLTTCTLTTRPCQPVTYYYTTTTRPSDSWPQTTHTLLGGGGLGACPSKGLENIRTNRRSVAYNRVWLIKLISFLCSKAPRKKKISSASCPGGVGKTGKSDSSGSSESGSETHKSLGGSPLTQPRNASRCGAGGGGDQFKLKLGEFSGRSSRFVIFPLQIFLLPSVKAWCRG